MCENYSTNNLQLYEDENCNWVKEIEKQNSLFPNEESIANIQSILDEYIGIQTCYFLLREKFNKIWDTTSIPMVERGNCMARCEYSWSI